MGRAVRRGNKGTSVCGYGIDSFTTYRTVVGSVIGRCKRLSVLIGGTKVAGSNLVVGVGRRSFSSMLGMGLGNAFGAVHRDTHRVLGREDKGVVGVSSISKVLKGINRTGCTTSGTNIVNLAGAVTERLNDQKVAMGTVTPKFMSARVARMLSRRVERGTYGRVVLKHFKGPRSVTGATMFLTSSGTSCVAKRIVDMSNNVGMWVEEAG